jgi:hypothetical protein
MDLRWSNYGLIDSSCFEEVNKGGCRDIRVEGDHGPYETGGGLISSSCLAEWITAVVEHLDVTSRWPLSTSSKSVGPPRGDTNAYRAVASPGLQGMSLPSVFRKPGQEVGGRLH